MLRPILLFIVNSALISLLRPILLFMVNGALIPLLRPILLFIINSVTDYRHCVETQDRHLEGFKIASTPPYILIEDQYCLQITVPISATYYPIMSYYLHLLRVYIEALESYLQLSRSCNSSHCKAYK